MLITAKKHNSGFTVIELIVSASIIAIISIMVVANLRGSTQRNSLGNEAERLSSVIRQAHIYSLIGTTVGGIRPVGGFGVHLEECTTDCSYILFADFDEDYIYSAANDTLVQQLGMLDNNVQFFQLKPDPPAPPSNILDIAFVPPYGDIYINGDILDGSATTTLSFANSSYFKQVILNRLSGRIDIQ